MLPDNFYDLAIEVALIRPGSIQGGAVHPYIKRKQGKEPTSYLHPLLEKSLAKTCGVPLFQEQLREMAIDVGGFTGGDADALRKAMGSSRSKKRMLELEDRFMSGAAKRRVESGVAQQIFSQIAAFANYGFPESHAISFANLVYLSAWLKLYHHAVFTAGLLRAQPMGFYSPQSLIADASRHGVPILPVDINQSEPATDLERVADVLGVRLGFDSVSDVGAAAREITNCRPANGYSSINDLADRTEIPRRALERLASAGAFDRFGVDRRQALWIAGAQSGSGPGVLPGASTVSSAPVLPLMDQYDLVLAELISTGITVGGYPTELLRSQLTQRGYVSTQDALDADDGQLMVVAAIITHRLRWTRWVGQSTVILEWDTTSGYAACGNDSWP